MKHQISDPKRQLTPFLWSLHMGKILYYITLCYIYLIEIDYTYLSMIHLYWRGFKQCYNSTDLYWWSNLITTNTNETNYGPFLSDTGISHRNWTPMTYFVYSYEGNHISLPLAFLMVAIMQLIKKQSYKLEPNLWLLLFYSYFEVIIIQTRTKTYDYYLLTYILDFFPFMMFFFIWQHCFYA